MTISTTLSRITYAGDGTTVSFAIPFVFFGADEIDVIERHGESGAETGRILTTDYTVAGGGGTTGTVTALVPPPLGRSWTILRRTHRTQMVDYTPNDPFPAETHERALDRLTALMQELDDKLGRSATLSPTSSITGLVLPDPAADRLIGWKGDLSGLENKHIPVGTTIYASVAAARAGLATSEAVTPRSLAALWRRGADIASAAVLAAPDDLDLGGYHLVTGGATIAALWPGAPAGLEIELRFAEALTLGHDSDALILPGGADVDALAGDVARFRAEGGDLWRCVSAPPHWYGGGGDVSWSLPVSIKGAGYAALLSDLGSELCFTAAGVTLALPSAAAAGNGSTLVIRNAAGGGEVTIDPDGSETLDGLATRRLRPGDCVLIRGDGTHWRTVSGHYSYDSGEQTITAGGLLTLAHGLGRVPYLVQLWARCKSADQNYAVDEEVLLSTLNYAGMAVNAATGLRADATNILVRIGTRAATSIAYMNASSAAEAYLTNTSWRLIARAKAS